jgi:hypothetical protein
VFSRAEKPAIAGSIAAAVARGARQANFQKQLSDFRKTFSVCSVEIEKKVLRVTKDPLSWTLIIFYYEKLYSIKNRIKFVAFEYGNDQT